MKILRYGSIVAVAILAVTIGFMSCSRGGMLERIVITPANPTIATGTAQQFTALAIFSNGTAIDWTTAAAWTSSDVNSVTTGTVLGTYGLARSLATGTTGTFTITATDTANQISGTATLYVTDPQSIAITPANPFMAVGTSHQFTATATLLQSDGTSTTTQNITSFATWTTSDTTIATISSSGVVTTGTTPGTTTIMASLYSLSTPTAVTTLTVTDTPIASITVTPANPIISLATTTTQQFNVQGLFQNGTTTPDLTSSVTWHSSNPGVATISDMAPTIGLATALVTGATGTTSTTITATDPITGHSNSTTLYVTP